MATEQGRIYWPNYDYIEAPGNCQKDKTYLQQIRHWWDGFTTQQKVLRLPLYHCELNPIELAWSVVKRHVKSNNKTFKLPDVKNLLIKGVTKVDAEMWKNFISLIIKEEDKV